jgi:nucleotide-binding universal stress UspA family protein
MFERIVCGVDGSAASVEAARQADLVLADGGRLVLVAAIDLSDAIHFQIAPTAVHAARRALEKAEELDRLAHEALARARTEVVRAHEPVTVEVSGEPSRCLAETATAEGASLIAVGSHGLRRIEEVTVGSVTARLLRHAPCSGLVARAPAEGRWTPRRIVVGTDGSEAAAGAVAVAATLGERLTATVETVSIEHQRAAPGLLEAAAGADLVVVGHRGRHGARLLGSVSERVAHSARCSVLVIRDENV